MHARTSTLILVSMSGVVVCRPCGHQGAAFDESQVEKKVPTATQNINRRDFTLRDMVDWGLRHPALATDALLALKTELQKTRRYVVRCAWQLCYVDPCVPVCRFPVLIAIDGLNHLYEPTPYFVEGKRYVC